MYYIQTYDSTHITYQDDSTCTTQKDMILQA